MNKTETITTKKGLTVDGVIKLSGIETAFSKLTERIKYLQKMRIKYFAATDTTGRKIIEVLLEGPKYQVDIYSRVRIEQSLCSQRLKKFIELGLVKREQVGKYGLFSLVEEIELVELDEQDINAKIWVRLSEIEEEMEEADSNKFNALLSQLEGTKKTLKEIL